MYGLQKGELLMNLGSEKVKEKTTKQKKKENANRKHSKKQPMNFLLILMYQVWTSVGIVVIY